mmetsp:Transcript_47191/g.142903  ORF Transcript_47191/g.142903 Transcript_47191/m.142903 type:complete len:255 (+) Transcript_47191:315-1079(+)
MRNKMLGMCYGQCGQCGACDVRMMRVHRGRDTHSRLLNHGSWVGPRNMSGRCHCRGNISGTLSTRLFRVTKKCIYIYIHLPTSVDIFVATPRRRWSVPRDFAILCMTLPPHLFCSLQPRLLRCPQIILFGIGVQRALFTSFVRAVRCLAEVSVSHVPLDLLPAYVAHKRTARRRTCHLVAAICLVEAIFTFWVARTSPDARLCHCLFDCPAAFCFIFLLHLLAAEGDMRWLATLPTRLVSAALHRAVENALGGR